MKGASPDTIQGGTPLNFWVYKTIEFPHFLLILSYQYFKLLCLIEKYGFPDFCHFGSWFIELTMGDMQENVTLNLELGPFMVPLRTFKLQGSYGEPLWCGKSHLSTRGQGSLHFLHMSFAWKIALLRCQSWLQHPAIETSERGTADIFFH